MARVSELKPGHYLIQTKKGLDLKIPGAPDGLVQTSPMVSRVGLLADDYPMMKPSFLVSQGDQVKTGQALFTDRLNPAIKFTSPGAGIVEAIHRGDKRKFISIVISLSESAVPGSLNEIQFGNYTSGQIGNLPKKDIQEILLESGLWTSIRNRPFGVIADPAVEPHSIFIAAVDTHPHSPPPAPMIQEHREAFSTGIRIVSKLTSGKVYLCKPADNVSTIPVFRTELFTDGMPENLIYVDIQGPHPAGNAGTHIHFLDPVGQGKNVWYINYQDVIAIGYLFITGRLFTERWISVAGPACMKPALMKTRQGASIDELVAGRKMENAGAIRQVSGSLLSGNTAHSESAFLGRYHHQVSLVKEGRERKFLGWLSPGFKKYSFKNIYVSNFIKPSAYDFNTSTNGSVRAMVPVEIYDKIMPLDIYPVFLLRAILMGDIERGEELGVLELDEEDLALCTFVSPEKKDYGYLLRTMLNRIKKGE